MEQQRIQRLQAEEDVTAVDAATPVNGHTKQVP